MKKLHTISVAMILIGTLQLVYSALRGGPDAWTPVHLPFPGAGFGTRTSFEVYQSGTFRLEATVPVRIPTNEIAMPEIPPAECALRVLLAKDDRPTNEVSITSLRHSSRYYWGSEDYYVSNEEWELSPGEYQLTVSSDLNCDLASTRGCSLSLTQYKHPVETIIYGAFRFWSAVTLCAIGLVGLAVSEMRSLRGPTMQSSVPVTRGTSPAKAGAAPESPVR